ncbi:MAG TPA: hypothetical protein VF168_12260 [Trueperaceae bacterium]
MSGFRFLSERPVPLVDLVIEGPRVRLRATAREDAEAIFHEFSARITEYMIPKPAGSIDETLEPPQSQDP